MVAADALIGHLFYGADNRFAGVSDRDVARERSLENATRTYPVPNAAQRAKLRAAPFALGNVTSFPPENFTEIFLRRS